MFRALFRMLFRALLLLVLFAGAIGFYHLYRSGRLARVQNAVEDATIVGSLKAAFAVHRDLAERAIRVESKAGAVVLRGGVATEAEKSAAEDIARSVEGVVAVENQIEIDQALDRGSESSRSIGETLDEVALLAKVKTALRLDRETRGLDIEVAVRSDTVVLTGRVPSKEVQERVLRRVQGVSGVKNLEDRLQVVESARSSSSGSNGFSR